MFLRCDVLRNIVPLKMLAAYPDAIQAQYHEDGAEAGALLLLEGDHFVLLRQADQVQGAIADWIMGQEAHWAK